MRTWKITNATDRLLNGLNLVTIFGSLPAGAPSFVSIEPGQTIEVLAEETDWINARFIAAVEALGFPASLSAPVENAVYIDIV